MDPATLVITIVGVILFLLLIIALFGVEKGSAIADILECVFWIILLFAEC